MEFTSAAGRRHFDGYRRALSTGVLALDFDGTLAPVVEDPDLARILPGAVEALAALGERIRTLAVVTGRPVAQVLELGELHRLADQPGGRGLEVYGHYGNESWTAADRVRHSPAPPPGLTALEQALPELLEQSGVRGVHVESKGLSVAVHTRRCPDPAAAERRLTAPLAELAARHGLVVEPGRHVLEIRGPGRTKGDVVRALAERDGVTALGFVGDDLGDLAAFEAVQESRAEGRLATLLVASASTEQSALVALADVVVDGPPGVLALLRQLGEAQTSELQ